jgi:hypothetical protein
MLDDEIIISRWENDGDGRGKGKLYLPCRYTPPPDHDYP